MKKEKVALSSKALDRDCAIQGSSWTHFPIVDGNIVYEEKTIVTYEMPIWARGNQ